MEVYFYPQITQPLIDFPYVYGLFKMGLPSLIFISQINMVSGGVFLLLNCTTTYWFPMDVKLIQGISGPLSLSTLFIILVDFIIVRWFKGTSFLASIVNPIPPNNDRLDLSKRSKNVFLKGFNKWFLKRLPKLSLFNNGYFKWIKTKTKNFQF